MINVYFTASTSFDGKYLENYKKIIEYLSQNGCQIVSGQQIVDPNLLKRDEKINKKEIYVRETERIDKADCLIAEVSHPSHGVGGEIIYALNHNKPVLGLLFKDGENKISPIIEGNPADIFFLERYNFEKLPYILKHFTHYLENLKKRKGKLVVFEGGDGSGKTMQAKLLIDRLKKTSIPYKYIDFPQYYASFHGKTVARFLRGEFGDIEQVSPYLASLAYAVDRVSIKEEVEDFLNQGGLIVANRYATSSIAHQGAKFEDKKEREKFMSWLYDMEYKAHRIPKENLVIFLYVPWEVSTKLIANKKKGLYLKGKEDIHERNLNYRKKVEKVYLDLAKRYRHWIKVDCVKDGKILPPDVIHDEIVKILRQKKYI